MDSYGNESDWISDPMTPIFIYNKQQTSTNQPLFISHVTFVYDVMLNSIFDA